MILDMSTQCDDCIERTTTPSGLRVIHRPSCAAAIWERDPLPRFQRWIDAVPAEQLPKARMILRPEAVYDALLHIARACKTPECTELDLLIEDVTALAAIFASIMKSPFLRLRLDVITTNACSKFHIDAVKARLICTYRGSGTHYGLSENGNAPEQIMAVPTGSPIILRGTRWPEAPVSGLLHRSPPIVGTGETRLLLVLDPVDDAMEEAENVYMH